MSQRLTGSASGSLFTSPLFFWIILLLALAPWAIVSWLGPANYDVLWLCLVMERILDGLSMSTHAYETNPPLSMLIYVIPTALHKFMDIPVKFAALGQSFALLVISAAMLWQVLKNFATLTDAHRKIALFGFILFGSVGTGVSFGEKDQYIGLIMPAFVLIQLSITQGIHPPTRWTWPFMFLGAVLIMVKPHHGLLPALLIGHRILKTRNLSFLKDPDFVALAITSALYIPITWFFFRDYIDIILPDVMTYYYPVIVWNDVLPNTLSTAICIVAAGLLVYEFLRGSAPHKFLYFLVAAAAISLIPVLVQAKGFYYHFLPAIIFLGTASSLILYELAQKYKPFLAYAIPLSMLITILGAYILAQPKFTFPDYHTISDIIVAANSDTPNKAYWIYDDNMDLAQQIRALTGVEYGSRFASTWFLNSLYQDLRAKDKGLLTEPQQAHARAEFLRLTGMIAEDITSYKPNIALVLSPDFFYKNYEIKFDMIGFLSENPAFKKEWGNYVYERTVSFEQTTYFRDEKYPSPIKTFDLYRREPPN